jgi:hypothetical protein
MQYFLLHSQGFVVAMRGQCPHCGSEVYCFMASPEFAGSDQRFIREASECHVCTGKLEFRAFILDKKAYEVEGEDPIPAWSPLKKQLRRWAYGRVYARSSKEDLLPNA